MGVVAVVSLVAFEAMAVATVMPIAVRELHGLAWYAWAFSGFVTASLFGTVWAGELADSRGPLVPFAAGLVAFGAGLLGAGSATTMAAFVLARGLQGVGAGLIIVTLYVVVGRAYPDRMRPRAVAAMSSAWVLPSVIGPALAGWVAEHAGWRWVFLALPPLIAPAVLLMLPTVRRLGRAEGGEARSHRKRLAAGAAVGATVLQYAGQRPHWLDLVPLLAGGALLGLTVPRLLPDGVLRARPGLPTVVLMRGILAGAFFGAETFVPLMLIEQQGTSATVAGLSLTGAALGWSAGSWYQGRSSTSVSRGTLIRLGCLAVVAGIGGIALAASAALPGPEAAGPAVAAAVAGASWCLGGLGMGLAMGSVSVLLFQLSPDEEQGLNSAALQMSDALGGIVFIGLGGALFSVLHARPGWGSATFVAIDAVMAALALVGAALAPRTAPRQ